MAGEARAPQLAHGFLIFGVGASRTGLHRGSYCGKSDEEDVEDNDGDEDVRAERERAKKREMDPQIPSVRCTRTDALVVLSNATPTHRLAFAAVLSACRGAWLTIVYCVSLCTVYFQDEEEEDDSTAIGEEDSSVGHVGASARHAARAE